MPRRIKLALKVLSVLTGFVVVAFVALAAAYPCRMISYCDGETATNPWLIVVDNPSMRASFYPDATTAYLLDPLEWKPPSNLEARYAPVYIPKGFLTDFASLPPFYVTITNIGMTGDYRRMMFPAILHDYAYWTQTSSREAADELLKNQLREAEIPEGRVQLVYWAVRTFGFKAWNDNRAAREAGEKKILMKFPGPEDDWIAWRKRRDVYAD